MEQRLQFVSDYLRQQWSMSELCARYEISRQSGYKWIARYEAEGAAGILDHSRRPHRSPNATPTEVVDALVTKKRRHPRWGPKKLLLLLAAEHPDWHLPAPSTASSILKRRGLVKPQRRRRRRPSSEKPRTESQAPNDVWTADFKGEFRTKDSLYCYPLTILDDHSRYLLACRALLSPNFVDTQTTFARLFRDVGLPRIIRTDNGKPFAGNGLARLSRLAVWWIRLGITPELIAPAHPEQNGRHERLHRTLKDGTVCPPAPSSKAQQRRFNRFREEYNQLRPHESLDQVPPATYYAHSPRPWPARLPPLNYPAHFELRRVSTNGCIIWHRRPIFVTSVLTGHCIGLEELSTGVWDVHFGPRRIGVFYERKLHIEEVCTLTPQS